MGSLDDPKKMDPKDLEVYPFQSLSSRGYLSIYIYIPYIYLRSLPNYMSIYEIDPINLSI